MTKPKPPKHHPNDMNSPLGVPKLFLLEVRAFSGKLFFKGLLLLGQVFGLVRDQSGA